MAKIEEKEEPKGPTLRGTTLSYLETLWFVFYVCRGFAISAKMAVVRHDQDERLVIDRNVKITKADYELVQVRYYRLYPWIQMAYRVVSTIILVRINWLWCLDWAIRTTYSLAFDHHIQHTGLEIYLGVMRGVQMVIIAGMVCFLTYAISQTKFTTTLEYMPHMVACLYSEFALTQTNRETLHCNMVARAKRLSTLPLKDIEQNEVLRGSILVSMYLVENKGHEEGFTIRSDGRRYFALPLPA